MNPEGLYFTCPACGEDVPRAAKSCPDCGACEKSGWSEEARYDGLDLPDLDSDQAFPPRTETRVKDWMAWAVALIVLLAFLWMTLRGGH